MAERETFPFRQRLPSVGELAKPQALTERLSFIFNKESKTSGKHRPGPAGMVLPEPAHPALPHRPQPLPRLAERDHAAADPRFGGAAVLRALSGGAAGHPGAGGLRGRKAAQALGGSGLLQPGAQPPESRPHRLRGVRRRASGRLRRPPRPARHRGLHGGGHRVHQLRAGRACRGRKCAAGVFQIV